MLILETIDPRGKQDADLSSGVNDDLNEFNTDSEDLYDEDDEPSEEDADEEYDDDLSADDK